MNVDLKKSSVCWLATAGLSHLEQTPLGESENGLTAIAELLNATPCGSKLRDLAASAKAVIAEARRTALDMTPEETAGE